MAVRSAAKGPNRVTQALDTVAQLRNAPSSRQLFERLGVPRSSGYELLSGLVQHHFLHSRAGGAWVLGDEIHVLAMSRYGLGNIAAQIAPVLETLQEDTQEVVQLAVLEGASALITHTFGSLRAMRMVIDVGTRLPVTVSASGRLLIAHLSDRALHQCVNSATDPASADTKASLIYSSLPRTCPLVTPRVREPRPLKRLGPRLREDDGKGINQRCPTPLNGENFIREVREARKRGFCVISDPGVEDVSSVAAPVIDKKGQCVATVSLVLPTARLKNSRDSLLALVCAAAAKLSRTLAV